MYLNEPEVANEVVKKICFICYQRIGVGIQHSCTKKETVENLKILLISKGITRNKLLFIYKNKFTYSIRRQISMVKF